MSNVINVNFQAEQAVLPFLDVNHKEVVEETMPRYIDYPKAFEVGMRIYCGLYGGKDGTIVAIHGKQDPDSIKVLSGFIHSGGNAEIDIAWDTCGESGGFSHRNPESIVRGVQWKMLSGYRDPSEAIAEAKAYLDKKEKEKAEAEIRFKKAMEKVKKDYSYLTEDNNNDYNIVQKNLRAMLKREFPKTKFKVIKESYDSRRVEWTDGPTVNEVKKITGLFENGSFNGMEDIYEYNASPFNNVFGGCKYIFESREHSNEKVSEAIDRVWDTYRSSFDGHDKPVVEMYKKGGMRSLYAENLNKDFSQLLWEELYNC